MNTCPKGNSSEVSGESLQKCFCLERAGVVVVVGGVCSDTAQNAVNGATAL